MSSSSSSSECTEFSSECTESSVSSRSSYLTNHRDYIASTASQNASQHETPPVFSSTNVVSSSVVPTPLTSTPAFSLVPGFVNRSGSSVLSDPSVNAHSFCLAAFS